MSIRDMRDIVKSAEEQLAKAREDYNRAIAEAIESGNVTEVVRSEWKTYVTIDNEVKNYCAKCGAIGGKTEYCHHCGAIMSNPSSPVKFITELMKQPASPQKGPTATEMVQTLISKGLRQVDICQLGGFGRSCVSNWAAGKACDSKNYAALEKLYKEMTA